ncbi:DUF4907 domain-containing protein [Tellurirhabdus rosea]|uniref:DUF4907 domain-containing protein n=1 Tax=Tellurirhabdus rosea TaxID=2674997 RepID=UPI002254F83E|nr:DUF4907 domain-containing protein [Tellurirhabdus rosea]
MRIRTQRGPESALYRWWLLFLFGSLTLTTAYKVYRRPVGYELRVFSADKGWGYLILRDRKPLIYQPTVPGVAGHAGFSDRDQARRAGETVVRKLRSGQSPPTLTATELQRLGVTSP